MPTPTRIIKVLSEDEVKSAALLPEQSFKKFTALIHDQPHNPVLWYNRAVAVFAMGHADQAFCDAEHAGDLMASSQPCVIDAVISSYLDSNPDLSARGVTLGSLKFIEVEPAFKKLYWEIMYTAARALFVCRFQSDYFRRGLAILKRAMNFLPHDTDFQTKAKRLEEEAKRDYRKLLEDIKIFGPHYGCTMRPIDRRGMCHGRYPWDTTDARGRAARTKEGLQALEREYKEVLKKLGASKVDVRFANRNGIAGGSDDVQGTGIMNGGLQVGMYAKGPIRKEKAVLHERPIAIINKRLDNDIRCEHCCADCNQHSRSHECPRCHIAYCSSQCRKDADATYHQALCGRHDRFKWLFELVRPAKSSAALFPLKVVKLFAMSLQTSTPLLELPGISRLRPWEPPAQGGVSYVVAPLTMDYYLQILDSFDVGTEKRLDFDYWIFETLCRMIMSNSYRVEGRDDHMIGSEICEASSWFNHSCDPNCYKVDDQVRTLRAILPGEELTIAYIAEGELRQHRQLLLEQTYGFICTCSRCETEK